MEKLLLFLFNLSSATEAHDDDGLPHTLEHLVFMGSENYPYKVHVLQEVNIAVI